LGSLKTEIQKLKEIAHWGETYASKIKALDKNDWVNFGYGVFALQLPRDMWPGDPGFDLTIIESDSIGYFPSIDTPGSTHYRMPDSNQVFLCLSGRAFIELDGIMHPLSPGESIDILAGMRIRIMYEQCKGLFMVSPGNAETKDIEFS